MGLFLLFCFGALTKFAITKNFTVACHNLVIFPVSLTTFIGNSQHLSHGLSFNWSSLCVNRQVNHTHGRSSCGNTVSKLMMAVIPCGMSVTPTALIPSHIDHHPQPSSESSDYCFVVRFEGISSPSSIYSP